jgi:transcriptional regulator with XRE-family HTH domain
MAVTRLWIRFGLQVRDARMARGWTAAELARRSGISAGFLSLIESGQSGSAEASARIAAALGRQAEMVLVDPRRAERKADLSIDLVHSAIGEFEAGHLRPFGFGVGVDEPYQHFQFAGRGDVISWSVQRRALLHIENRTRFPDLQETAGSYNAKRAYLGRALAERLGIAGWQSEAHVMAALWSSEVVHVVRRRVETFRSLCPDSPDAFDEWWRGEPPLRGNRSIMVVIDPLARGRQRPFVGLDAMLTITPRYRGYVNAAAALALRREGPTSTTARARIMGLGEPP